MQCPSSSHQLHIHHTAIYLNKRFTQNLCFDMSTAQSHRMKQWIPSLSLLTLPNLSDNDSIYLIFSRNKQHVPLIKYKRVAHLIKTTKIHLNSQRVPRVHHLKTVTTSQHFAFNRLHSIPSHNSRTSIQNHSAYHCLYHNNIHP